MNHLQLLSEKIFNFSNQDDRLRLKRLLAYSTFKSFKLGFTNGCFDLLHLGHVDYLAKTADNCDVLILGLNSDTSVQRIKGKHRPISDQKSRATILSAFSFINVIVIFDEDTPYQLIKFIQPDLLVKGKDYLPENIVGYDIVKAKNGEILTIDIVEGYSTTFIEKKIIENANK